MTDTLRHTVLIIDDEELILSSLQRLLRREFNVVTATSGQRGLELMREQEVHVILSDQRMPGMTGSEFLANVKGEYPDAIRLMLTGYADLESVIAAINTGQIFRYLVKPWNPDELLATVREGCVRYDLIVQNRRLTRDLIAANRELEERVEARTAELAAANVHLRELNHLKDEFLAITSHDLRSPLASIQMLAQLMLDDSAGLSADEQREMTENIYSSARHLIALVSNLLDLAKLEAGKQELDRSDLRLSEVAARSIEALAFNARAKHITIELTAAPDEPVISGDDLKLYRVFNNLLSNAIKFTPEGGSITVSIAPDEAGVSARVTDTGLGIPPAELPKLFSKFQQLHKSGTQGEKGTGLGLAIVKELVELHGGRVAVDSEVGRGTTFIAHLPILN